MKKKSLLKSTVLFCMFSLAIQSVSASAEEVSADQNMLWESELEVADELSVVEYETEDALILSDEVDDHTIFDVSETENSEEAFILETDIVENQNYEAILTLPTLSFTNDTYNTASKINVNTAYTDNLTSDSDVNWYKFTISKAGYISLDFNHEYIEYDRNYWTVVLYDSTQRELNSYEFTGSKTAYSEGKIGVPAGTYYLKIGKTYYYSDKNYNLKINYTASSVWETEFNDDYTTADTISVNNTYYGSLRNSDDADWYKFTISKAGYISLDFNHEYIESNSRYWTAVLYDPAQRELSSYGFDGSTTSYSQGKIGVPAGTYYLKIVRAYTGLTTYSDKNYNLKINYTASSVWETEFNNDYTTADTISVNNTYYGRLMDWDDADWYKFTISKAGYISLDFNHEYIESNSRYWTAVLYDPAQRELSSYGFDGSTTSYSQGKIGVSAGTYYLKIVKAYTGLTTYSDKNYNLKINYTASSVWETEFNDDYTTANTISVNNTYYGSLMNSDDTDWYKVSISTGGLKTLSFNHDYIESGYNYWQIYLYDSAMKEAGHYYYAGNEKSTSDTFNLAAGTYYIKILDYNYSSGSYNFKLSTHTHSYKAVITKATSYGNGMIVKTCSCGAVSGKETIYAASGVKLSSESYTYNGKVKTPSVKITGSNGAVISSSNYTISYPNGRSKVGSYVVKITFKGDYYTGEITRSFKILPKKTSITKVTAKTGGFTVKWKKQKNQVSGYQIEYSTSKKFLSSSQKLITKNSTTSTTIRTYWRRQKYYVRIRTYKNVNGSRYYSAWSSIKKVTTK